MYRILDSHDEDFKLSKAYRDKVKVIDVITAPEIEMLVVINEGKYDTFSRTKHGKKVSDYCKQDLKISNVKSKEFIMDYFSDTDKLVEAIKEYKRVHNFRKNEACLADLLK